MDRRQFLTTAAAGGAAALGAGYALADGPSALPSGESSWADIKSQFDIAPGIIQMSSFYLASHPKPVREAIERHRRGLDRESHGYIEQNVGPLERAVRDQASAYLGVNADELAFTDSTTMGLGLVYSGMKLKPGQEILTDTRDHIVTALSADHAAQRTGATVRQAPLYADPSRVSVDEVVGNVRRNLRDSTRLLAVTWVHSGTGVKCRSPRSPGGARSQSRQGARSADIAVGRRRPRPGHRKRLDPRARRGFLHRRDPQMADRAARHRAGVGQARGLADGPGDDPDVRPDVANGPRRANAAGRDEHTGRIPHF